MLENYVEVKVPGSKSCTIRALLFGMLADGETIIHNPVLSKDTQAAIDTARAFGAEVNINEKDNIWIVKGTNNRPKAPKSEINTMNSGTTTSFAIGLAALISNRATTIFGDEQTSNRTWLDELNALKGLGAEITYQNNGNPPFTVQGPIHGGVCNLTGLNSQHISGLLAPSALLPEEAFVEIFVEDPHEEGYIQLTIDWLKKFGIEVAYSQDYKSFCVKGGQRFKACECFVPSDWSSATFPMVAAACLGKNVVIKDVDFFDAQKDKIVANILFNMGVLIVKDIEENRLFINGSTPLYGIEIDMKSIPDAFPALAVAATRAKGQTSFINIKHIREKETDRVAVMFECLKAFGADVEILEDRFIVNGGKKLKGTTISSHKDHRIAMAMAICALTAEGDSRVEDYESVSVSFPNFLEVLTKIVLSK